MMDQRPACHGGEGNAVPIEACMQEGPVRLQGAGHYTDLIEAIGMCFHQVEDSSAGGRQFLLGTDDALYGQLRERSRPFSTQSERWLCPQHRLNMAVEKTPGKGERRIAFQGKEQRCRAAISYRLKQRKLHLCEIIKAVIADMAERSEKG